MRKKEAEIQAKTKIVPAASLGMPSKLANCLLLLIKILKQSPICANPQISENNFTNIRPQERQSKPNKPK